MSNLSTEALIENRLLPSKRIMPFFHTLWKQNRSLLLHWYFHTPSYWQEACLGLPPIFLSHLIQNVIFAWWSRDNPIPMLVIEPFSMVSLIDLAIRFAKSKTTRPSKKQELLLIWERRRPKPSGHRSSTQVPRAIRSRDSFHKEVTCFASLPEPHQSPKRTVAERSDQSTA